MIDSTLLSILVCPEDKTSVRLISSFAVEQINRKIAEGTLQNRGAKPVQEPLQTGLVRADKKFLYPIRDNIPIMLIEEAIPLGQIPDLVLE